MAEIFFSEREMKKAKKNQSNVCARLHLKYNLGIKSPPVRCRQISLPAGPGSSCSQLLSNISIKR